MAFMYEPGRGKQSVACSKALFETILNDEKIRKTIQYYRNLKARQKELEARGEVQQAAAVKGKAAAVKSQMPGWLFSTRDIEPWEWIDSKGKNHGISFAFAAFINSIARSAHHFAWLYSAGIPSNT